LAGGTLAEIDYKAAQRNALPPGHKVFLYVNVMNWKKSAIAAYRGPDGKAMPHPPFWEERKHRFDDPAMVTAFLHHLEFLVLKYRPD
jgi:hypothetical protein